MSNIISVAEGKIVLYSTPDSNVYVDVVFKDEIFWMTQKAMAELFDVDKSVISRHLKNIFDDEELSPDSTVSKMEIVQNEGGREVSRTPDFYSLDAIIAVGYRVKAFNSYLSKYRIRIEHVNRRIKRFKILQMRYRNKQRKHLLRLSLISGIYNFELRF